MIVGLPSISPRLSLRWLSSTFQGEFAESCRLGGRGSAIEGIVGLAAALPHRTSQIAFLFHNYQSHHTKYLLTIKCTCPSLDTKSSRTRLLPLILQPLSCCRGKCLNSFALTAINTEIPDPLGAVYRSKVTLFLSFTRTMTFIPTNVSPWNIQLDMARSFAA